MHRHHSYLIRQIGAGGAEDDGSSDQSASVSLGLFGNGSHIYWSMAGIYTFVVPISASYRILIVGGGAAGYDGATPGAAGGTASFGSLISATGGSPDGGGMGFGGDYQSRGGAGGKGDGLLGGGGGGSAGSWRGNGYKGGDGKTIAARNYGLGGGGGGIGGAGGDGDPDYIGFANTEHSSIAVPTGGGGGGAFSSGSGGHPGIGAASPRTARHALDILNGAGADPFFTPSGGISAPGPGGGGAGGTGDDGANTASRGRRRLAVAGRVLGGAGGEGGHQTAALRGLCVQARTGGGGGGQKGGDGGAGGGWAHGVFALVAGASYNVTIPAVALGVDPVMGESDTLNSGGGGYVLLEW